MSNEISIPDLPAEFLNFSMTKKKILLYLKENSSSDLTSLSKEIGLTKMGILKHVEDLEKVQIVERFRDKSDKSVGRPKLYLRLGKGASNLFPKAYTKLTCAFLEYIQEELGNKGVREAFRRRKDEVYQEYREEIDDDNFDQKMKKLAKKRHDDGYMVELNVLKDKYELLEYNCPIVSVASKFPEACSSETELFRELLHTDVRVVHKVVSGHEVCRFHISKPKERIR